MSPSGWETAQNEVSKISPLKTHLKHTLKTIFIKMFLKIPSCPHSSWGQRCDWDSPRELVRIYTHTGWPRLLTQSYKICKKRSQSHLFSLSLSLCQTMDPLLQSFQLCPLGPVSLSLLSSSRSRSFITIFFYFWKCFCPTGCNWSVWNPSVEDRDLGHHTQSHGVGAIQVNRDL